MFPGRTVLWGLRAGIGGFDELVVVGFGAGFVLDEIHALVARLAFVAGFALTDFDAPHELGN